MSKFIIGDVVRIKSDIEFSDGVGWEVGTIARVVAYANNRGNWLTLECEGDKCGAICDTELEMVTPAPRQPTVASLIAEIAAALGHDPDTTTEAGVLADALAELTRLREENIALKRQLKEANRELDFLDWRTIPKED